MSDASLDQSKRSALLDKISALLAKTRANGCTESEAIAAAELAEKLMTKYGLSLSELETIPSPLEACETDGTPMGNQRCHEVVHCSNAIAEYTNTRNWYQRRGIINLGGERRRLHKHRGVIACYFGLVADVQTAIYLTNVLQVAMDTEWARYWKAHSKTSETNARTARANFMRAMAQRLSDRLEEMKAAQAQANVNNCKAIVLAKDRIVAQAYSEAGFRKPRTGYASLIQGDAHAFYAGQSAADRVTISRGALER